MIARYHLAGFLAQAGTNMLTIEQTQYVRDESIKAYPHEAIFLLTEEKGLYKVTNVADDTTKEFRVSSGDMQHALTENLLAVIHSHPDFEPCPSEADMHSQLAVDVTYGICATDGVNATNINYWGGIEKAPLIGRGFIHGIQDCYSLIKDYYESELNIELNEFPRSWEWWNKGQDLYSSNVIDEGFIRVDEPQMGDMIFMQIRSDVPNHGAIYVGNDLILHHITSSKAVDETRISTQEPIYRYHNFITHYYRHKSMYK